MATLYEEQLLPAWRLTTKNETILKWIHSSVCCSEVDWHFPVDKFKWHELKISYIGFCLTIIHYGNIYILIFLGYLFYLNSIILATVVAESITNWKAQKTECSQGNWF
jgi:hypothetical protein